MKSQEPLFEVDEEDLSESDGIYRTDSEVEDTEEELYLDSIDQVKLEEVNEGYVWMDKLILDSSIKDFKLCDCSAVFSYQLMIDAWWILDESRLSTQTKKRKAFSSRTQSYKTNLV